MQRISLIIIAIASLCVPISLACETDMNLDGYYWSFHRMQDGNKYHEAKNLGEFTEGNTLNLTAPCQGRHIDTIQIDWEDNHSDVYGELVVMPGNIRLGKRDISGKQRQSWSIGRNVNRFRLEFSGKRGHRCRVRFIRVFYGQNSGNGIQQQNNQRQNNQGQGRPLVDRLRLNNGQVVQNARFLKWDGTHVHVLVKTRNGQKEKHFLPEKIHSLNFADRWGYAVANDGGRFPIRIHHMNRSMIKFDKKLNGAVVPKPLSDIHNFQSIVFE